MVYELSFRFNVPTDRQTQSDYIDDVATTFEDVDLIGFGTTVLTINLKTEGESEELVIDHTRSLIEQAMPDAIYQSGEVLGITEYDEPNDEPLYPLN